MSRRVPFSRDGEPPFRMNELHGLMPFPPRTRLAEPSFEPRLARVFHVALDALARDDVPFLLGGAVALNAYTGIWRDTKDLDVFCRPRDAPRVLTTLARAGFDTEIVYDSWLGKGWIGEVFVDVIWRNANGLFPVEDAWIEDATKRAVLGREVLVLPVEALILSKMMVGGRYRFDGADLLHVFYAAHDRIDWRRLEEGAGEHAGLLLAYLHMFRWGYPAARDRVPDAVLARLERRAGAAPSGYGPFRALLLDLESYRVDVDGWGLPDPHRIVLEGIFGEAEGRS
jgi:hypothetical protein